MLVILSLMFEIEIQDDIEILTFVIVIQPKSQMSQIQIMAFVVEILMFVIQILTLVIELHIIQVKSRMFQYCPYYYTYYPF